MISKHTAVDMVIFHLSLFVTSSCMYFCDVTCVCDIYHQSDKGPTTGGNRPTKHRPREEMAGGKNPHLERVNKYVILANLLVE